MENDHNISIKDFENKLRNSVNYDKFEFIKNIKAICNSISTFIGKDWKICINSSLYQGDYTHCVSLQSNKEFDLLFYFAFDSEKSVIIGLDNNYVNVYNLLPKTDPLNFDDAIEYIIQYLSDNKTEILIKTNYFNDYDYQGQYGV